LEKGNTRKQTGNQNQSVIDDFDEDLEGKYYIVKQI
jgi:hypothetical protein